MEAKENKGDAKDSNRSRVGVVVERKEKRRGKQQWKMRRENQSSCEVKWEAKIKKIYKATMNSWSWCGVEG